MKHKQYECKGRMWAHINLFFYVSNRVTQVSVSLITQDICEGDKEIIFVNYILVFKYK